MSGLTDYAVFDVQSGIILRYGICMEYIVNMQANGTNERALPVKVDPVNEYIDPRTLVVTPLKTIAYGQAGLCIYGLPIPCNVTVEGQTYIVGDGDIDFDFTYPGLYEITLASPGYRTAKATIQHG